MDGDDRASVWRARWLAAARMSGLGLVLTLVAASCAPLEPDDVPGVVWEPDARPQIVDEAGVVNGWQFHLSSDTGSPLLEVHFDDDSGEAANATNPPPPGWDLRVAWISGLCGQSPTITVEGSSRRITRISIDDPNVLPPDNPTAACPSMGVPHAVDLMLSVEPPARIPVRLIQAGCHIAPYGVTPSPLPGCPRDRSQSVRIP